MADRFCRVVQLAVWLEQGRRQDVAAGGAKNTRGNTFLNTMLDVCSNRHEKSNLRYVNFIHILLDPESYTDMNAKPAEHRHLIFCNLGKLKDKKLNI